MVNVSTAGAIRRTQEHLDEGTEGTLEYPATSDLVGDAHGAHWVIAHRRCGREGDCEQSAHVDLFKIASAILRIALVGGVGREKCSTDGLSLDLRPGGSVRLVDEHLEHVLLAIGASVEVGAERDPVDIPEIIGGMTVLRLEGAVRPAKCRTSHEWYGWCRVGLLGNCRSRRLGRIGRLWSSGWLGRVGWLRVQQRIGCCGSLRLRTGKVCAVSVASVWRASC